jgi:ATP-binding cassette subfamily B protein
MIDMLLNVVGPSERKPLRRTFTGLVVESVLMGIGFVLMVPGLRALLAGDIKTAWAWLAAMIALLCVYVLVRYHTQASAFRVAMNLGSLLFERLGEHIVRLPLGWFTSDRVGRVGRITSQGVIDVMGVPAHFLRPLVTALITPITVIVLMFLFDWRLALAGLISIPVAGLAYRWAGDLVQRTDHWVDEAAVDAAGRLVEFAQSQAVLRAFSRGNSDLGKLGKALKEQRFAGRSQLFISASGISVFVLTVQCAFTMLLVLGTNLALGGDIDAAELTALLVLSARYVEPLINAADMEGALRISRNTLERMDKILATKPLPEPDSPKHAKDNSIAFKDVHFAYDERPLLQGISFTAPERSMTAIVGPSGAGKTTLLRLIARFWDVNDGSLQIGGEDVRDISTQELFARISIVFQDVYLFDGTIADNIRLGRQDATEEQVREAARLAKVDEITNRLPMGFNSRVGEGGTSLSGGERLRVSIARAILKNSPIVLLDEATAALDPVNEAAVQAGLRRLAENKTLLVVAHRLQTVIAADHIVVIENGVVAEQGRHDQLLAAGGPYAAIWRERKRAKGWRLKKAEDTT